MELIADALLVMGFVALVIGLALVNLALALCVGGGLLLFVGIILTGVALQNPSRRKGIIDRGPFERGGSEQ